MISRKNIFIFVWLHLDKKGVFVVCQGFRIPVRHINEIKFGKEVKTIIITLQSYETNQISDVICCKKDLPMLFGSAPTKSAKVLILSS